MIKSVITNTMLKSIMNIEGNRFSVSNARLPSLTLNRLRKNSKKKSSYASNRIEGNPLTELQADEVIESDEHKHFLRPEQEIRNYFLALSFLEDKLKKKEPVTVKMILEVQAIVEKGASKEKIGLRGAMPPGTLFAVYDSETGDVNYIPPEYKDVPELLYELEEYVANTDDHPVICAGIVHYQLVTIHPFEDGNGRTARLISGYLLELKGYGFKGIGSLEEYFAYDSEEYYNALQMGLPTLYYSGRNNPPNPEIWLEYYLRMVELYSSKVAELSEDEASNSIKVSLSRLREKEIGLLRYLLKNNIYSFRPIDIAREIGVNNKTIINRTAGLVEAGFVIPKLANQRIISYELTEYAKENRENILK